MYFADHHGKFIKLAFSNSLQGPWKVSSRKVLKLSDTPMIWDHIASPDIFVDDLNRKIYMTVHGKQIVRAGQDTVLSESADGLTFAQDPSYADEIFATEPYIRIFQYAGMLYRLNPRNSELAVSRAPDILGDFGSEVTVEIPRGIKLRHLSTTITEHTLTIFYSVIGDAPERIFRGEIDLSANWGEWALSNVECVRAPTAKWEGSRYPIVPSDDGAARDVNQLRDPFIFSDGVAATLFYSYAGESGIAQATLISQ